jgi:hypothetical protein
MGKGIHRVTPNSKFGRRMTQAKGARVPDGTQSEYAKQHAEHNLRVENERKARLEARKVKRQDE